MPGIRLEIMPTFEELSDTSQRLLCEIHGHARMRGRWPTVPRLARMLSLTEDDVSATVDDAGGDLVFRDGRNVALTLKGVWLLPDAEPERELMDGWVCLANKERLEEPNPIACPMEKLTTLYPKVPGQATGVFLAAVAQSEVTAPAASLLYLPAFARSSVPFPIESARDLLLHTVPTNPPVLRLSLDALAAALAAVCDRVAAGNVDRRRCLWLLRELQLLGPRRKSGSRIVRAAEQAFAWASRDFAAPECTESSLDLLTQALVGAPRAAVNSIKRGGAGAGDEHSTHDGAHADNFNTPVFGTRDGKPTITYRGVTASYPNLRGLQHIRALIEAEGREVHCMDLYYADIDPSSRPHAFHGDDAADQTALRQYRDRIKEIDQELDHPHVRTDPGRQQKLHADRDFLLKEVNAVTGLHGAPRKVLDDREKARKAVRAAILTALRAIEKKQPDLHARLKPPHIGFGATCHFQPLATPQG